MDKIRISRAIVVEGRDDVRAVFLVEIVQIGQVLEVVGVKLSALHHVVGLDIVGELDDLQGDIPLLQDQLD